MCERGLVRPTSRCPSPVAALLLSVAVAWSLASCGSNQDSSPDLARVISQPSTTHAPTTTSTSTTTTTLAPALDFDSVARVLITTTDIVLPVLNTLGDERWLVRTTCQNLAIVTDGEPIDRVHVVLDPGHGGSESGAVTNSGLIEADVNFAVAVAAESRLVDLGFEVLLTRYTDTRVPILTRAEIADSVEADLLVSIHHQGIEPMPTSDKPGTEVFYQQDSAASKRFAGLLHEEAIATLGTFDIEWFAGPDAGATYRRNSESGADFYGMVRRPQTSAVLAEMSFLGNAAEEELLNSQEFIDAEAQAIVDAIVRWFTSTDPGSGFVEPSFELRSDAGTGTLSGCTDPDLGPSESLSVDVDPSNYPRIDSETDPA